ncbi:MAG: hypothetical protein H6622_10785 [Halobacteriovoraceae bacterium]|nr:hypothetical protein [Halobacteriovoraceae bacterium]
MKNSKIVLFIGYVLLLISSSCGSNKEHNTNNVNSISPYGIDNPTGGSTFSVFADEVRNMRFKANTSDGMLYIYTPCNGDISWEYTYSGVIPFEDYRCYGSNNDFLIGTYNNAESVNHVVLGDTSRNEIHTFIVQKILDKKMFSIRLSDTHYAIYTTDKVTYEIDLQKPLEANPVFLLDNNNKEGFILSNTTSSNL